MAQGRGWPKAVYFSLHKYWISLVVYSSSHFSQQISSLLEVIFKKVILKIGSLAAILYEYNNEKKCLYLNVCWINPSTRIPIHFIILPKKNRQS